MHTTDEENNSTDGINIEEPPQGGSGEIQHAAGFKLKRSNIIAIAILAVICLLFFNSGNKESHAVLLVRFRDNPNTDTKLIENALKVGGLLDCGHNRQYVKVIKSMGDDFDKFGAEDSEGSYFILPAVLNWISSKGWKFQQKFCINMNNDNAEYYFTK